MHTDALLHGLHYAIVAAGLVGILALLAPQLHERRVAGHGSARVRAPRDQHEARVMLLRAEIATGALGRTTPGSGPALVAPTPEPTLPHAERVLLPAAFVGSAAAAGVHAAMAPSHLQHSTLFGAFFVGAALVQISWAAALVLGCSRTVLLAGAAVNTSFIGLWAVTRTLGLPVLLPQPEAVGPWDVTCVAWQVVVVVAILRLLASEPVPRRLAACHRWDERVVLFAISAAIVRPLAKSGQLRTNPLGAATAAIFFTCAVHHGAHSVHMLLPTFELDDTQGLAMRAAWGWPLAIWDIVGAVVAVYYWSLRRNYGSLMQGAQLFQDLRQREQQALELNDAVLQGLVVAKMALDLDQPRKANEALTASIQSASRIITELLGSSHSSLDLLRSVPAAAGAPALEPEPLATAADDPSDATDTGRTTP